MTTDDNWPDEGHGRVQRDNHIQQSGFRSTLRQFGAHCSTGRRLCTDGGRANPDDDESDSECGDDPVNTEDSPSIDIAPDVSLTPSVRDFIRADRSNECELCGADGHQEDVTLVIHHRTERQHDGTDHPDNLLLMCQTCHGRHHDTLPIEQSIAAHDEDAAQDATNTADEPDESEPAESGAEDSSDQTGSEADSSADAAPAADENDEPLPPRSEPNGADKEILRLLEDHGALSTGELAAHTDLSSQYVRRQCWKLSGEQLVVPRKDNTWDLKERADEETIRLGVPDDPDEAQRAGRDEVIRQMSAHGMTHTKIAEITGLSRRTVGVAVNRARALRIGEPNDHQVDLATIATRLSALLELIDHTQMDYQ